jgi:hypothetical protein
LRVYTIAYFTRIAILVESITQAIIVGGFARKGFGDCNNNPR